MSKVQAVFQRIEKKYMVSKEQYDLLIEKLKVHMNIDEYGVHTICNLYFDTEQDELIRHSLEKPIYKEKLRVRSYGVPNDDSKAFIEIKKKYKGIVYKSRIVTNLREAKAFLEDGAPLKEDSQIARELTYFMEFYKPVPKVFIAYDRFAMFGKEDNELRVTFDANIRSRYDDLWLDNGDHGERLIKEDYSLMEIKIAGAMPLWLSSILCELEIYPASFSKYGSVYKNSLKEKIARQHSMNKENVTENVKEENGGLLYV